MCCTCVWVCFLSNSDLRNNPITKFEIQHSDLSIFQSLSEFRVTSFESEACAKSKGTLYPVGKHGSVQICALAGKFLALARSHCV